MQPTLNDPGHLVIDPLSTRGAAAVVALARSLQRAAAAGLSQPLLRGKNLGLLCEADDTIDAAAFREAAVGLGAHVAHILPSLSELSTPHEIEHTARMLGRLYDAVECQGMASALVQQVGIDAGVPVYDGAASAAHPTAGLVERLEGSGSAADKRRFVLQAALLSTIA